MARLRQVKDGVSFRCPGCDEMHVVPTSGTPAWNWNGLLERPTISPSIDIKAGHYASSWKPGDECWCGKAYGYSCYRCHSVITDGRVFFATDSTHALAGQTVDLPEI